MHISNVKLPFYPPCEVKYGLQNKVSTQLYNLFFLDSYKMVSEMKDNP